MSWSHQLKANCGPENMVQLLEKTIAVTLVNDRHEQMGSEAERKITLHNVVQISPQLFFMLTFKRGSGNFTWGIYEGQPFNYWLLFPHIFDKQNNSYNLSHCWCQKDLIRRLLGCFLSNACSSFFLTIFYTERHIFKLLMKTETFCLERAFVTNGAVCGPQ